MPDWKYKMLTAITGTGSGECWLPFNAEYFVFHFAIQNYKN
jgi:hypothetical protein